MSQRGESGRKRILDAEATPVVHQRMRIVAQRVRCASVTHAESGEVVGRVGRGLLLLVGIHRDDTERDAEELVRKVLKVRLWSSVVDADGQDVVNREASTRLQWQRSVQDLAVGAGSGDAQPGERAGILVVSQFTLYGRTDKGAKPDYNLAMKPEGARVLFERVVALLRASAGAGLAVETGAFGEYMSVRLENDGPTTLVLESKAYLGAAKEQVAATE